jgi:hypothetical protein
MAPPDRVFNSPQQGASWAAASMEIVRSLVPEGATLDPLHHVAGHDPLNRVCPVCPQDLESLGIGAWTRQAQYGRSTPRRIEGATGAGRT